jgi:hypothetical protein
VWEIRVVVANDPHTGRSVQRSFTMHGDPETAEAYRNDLVERFGVDKRALYFAGVNRPGSTGGSVLARRLEHACTSEVRPGDA